MTMRVVKLQPKGKPPIVSEFPEDGEILDIRSAVPALKTDKLQRAAVDEALTFAGMASQIVVKDEETLGTANLYLKDVKTMMGKIEATFDPQITQAHNLHRSLLAEKKKFTDPLTLAERVVKMAVGRFYDEQDRRREAAEKERRRIEAEALAKAKALEDKAAKAKTEVEREKILDQAVEVLQVADQKGGDITAAAVAPKAQGLTITDNWKFEVINESEIPREYLMPDLVKIGRVVKALKGSAQIAGVRTYSEKVATNRGTVSSPSGLL
jgi:vacuolar-type H+-ATPase subunit H